ncbi:hypothetical protein PSA01_27310 [Pseudonocardia saturnea]|uniref:Uncharacterized protein n=1 Tax=Pseudonocardia saturnea TaxID=33909 RepID=A0ABQ0RYF4_9PSEU|nr:hypothetical protein Pdca_58050 [Pseudonocardia autotrophica]GEC25702.1 hypothetical protein PSA01_27310 [Pseudonocardia saturnea]
MVNPAAARVAARAAFVRATTEASPVRRRPTPVRERRDSIPPGLAAFAGPPAPPRCEAPRRWCPAGAEVCPCARRRGVPAPAEDQAVAA